MNIERLDRTLTTQDRQWAAIAVLTALAGIDTIDLAMRSATGSFQPFLGLGTCDAALDNALAACRKCNTYERDVYFRPARGIPASVVMLDDLPFTIAQQLAHGRAHMLVETSPQNYQLWLKTDRKLAEGERKAVQCALVNQHGGDPSSVSGEHFGRIPGFKNRKPKYNLPWVNLAQYSLDGAAVDVGDLLSTPRGECALEPPAGVHLLPSGGGAPAPATVSSDSQESHKEFFYACESLRHKVSRAAIISNISARALLRGKRRTAQQAEQYAARTFAAAERAVL